MTASNPEEQTDARRRGSAALGGSQRPRTAAPSQKIFVVGDRVVEKPPVLFSMPVVKVAEVETRRIDSSQSLAQEEARVSKGLDSKADATSKSESASGSTRSSSGSHSHGVRAPHFLSSAAQSSKKNSPPQAVSLSGPSAIEPSASVAETNEAMRVDEPTSGRRRAPATETAESELERLNKYQRAAVEEQSPHNEQTDDYERGASRTPKAQRPLPPVPEPVGVPAGRNWMEVIGSRAVIILLVLAIGVIAILANRDSKPRSAAELAILELDSSEDAGGATAEAVINRSENEAETERAAQQVDAGLERVSALNGPMRTTRNDTGATSQKTTSLPSVSSEVKSAEVKAGEVRAVEPEFDLADLMSEGSPSNATSSSTNTNVDILNPPSLSAPEVMSDFSTEATTPQNISSHALTAPAPATEVSPSGDWQRDLQMLGSEVGMQQPNSVAGNRWVREPGLQDSDAAISAAIDAARVNRAVTDSATQPANGSDAVITTSQPAGVPDWSRYLPTNPPPANPGYPQTLYPQNLQNPAIQGAGGYQPNLMPPGTINPPNTPTQNYPAQSFSAGQPYPQTQNGFLMPSGGAMQPASAPQFNSGQNQFNSGQNQFNSGQNQFNANQYNGMQYPNYQPNLQPTAPANQATPPTGFSGPGR